MARWRAVESAVSKLNVWLSGDHMCGCLVTTSLTTGMWAGPTSRPCLLLWVQSYPAPASQSWQSWLCSTWSCKGAEQAHAAQRSRWQPPRLLTGLQLQHPCTKLTPERPTWSL